MSDCDGTLMSWKLRYDMRGWQKAALDAWSPSRRGIISVVTGGGKTVFAEACMASFNNSVVDARFVIIVPTRALTDQWFVSLQEELGVSPDEIETVGDGQRYTGKKPVTICVINSARRLESRWVSPSSTMLIVDECHRAGSEENAKALKGEFGATLGLSATPEREYDEGFSQHVSPALGPIIYEYTYREAFSDGVIVPFTLQNIKVDLLQDEAAEYERLTKRIRSMRGASKAEGNLDDALKRLLMKRAAVSASASMRIPVACHLADKHRGQRLIVFHERVEAGNRISEILRARDHRATIYHAGMGPAIRRDNLRMFRRGLFDVLVCCRALDEGMNVPEAEVAIIASSTASRRQRIQRLGRVLRRSSVKDTAIIYTLFATEEEQTRLAHEAEGLQGVAAVTWAQGGRTRSA